MFACSAVIHPSLRMRVWLKADFSPCEPVAPLGSSCSFVEPVETNLHKGRQWLVSKSSSIKAFAGICLNPATTGGCSGKRRLNRLSGRGLGQQMKEHNGYHLYSAGIALGGWATAGAAPPVPSRLAGEPLQVSGAALWKTVWA